MKTNRRVNNPTIGSKLSLSGNDVILIESFDGYLVNQNNVSKTTIITVPDMYSTERNQLITFIKGLNERRLDYLQYAISKKFNAIRRTFLRDLAKLSTIIGDLVEMKEGTDADGANRAIYVYKAPLMDEVKPNPQAEPKAKG